MKLNDYIAYIRNRLREAKPRVVIVPPGENMTTLHWFITKEHGGVELRLSELVNEDSWLPMPDEIFGRIRNAMKTQATNGEPLVLLGLSGYLGLLTDKNKRAAIVALREWVDETAEREAVCLLRNDNTVSMIVNDVFVNPRYRQGKQLINIEADQLELHYVTVRAEVMLVGTNLSSFIPEECYTFQKYLRHSEDHPSDNFARRIVVASERRLAGISAEIRQLVCLRDFVREIHGVEDFRLSEEALRWMCEMAKKENTGKTMSEKLKALFFPEEDIPKQVLCVFNKHRDVEREAALWLITQVAPKRGYLEYVVRQEGILADSFCSAYVISALGCLDTAGEYAEERKVAIREADVRLSDAVIRMFIVRCEGQPTSRVAPWLNCGTSAERAELLRRCAEDGIVSNAVKTVYPEAEAYTNKDSVYNDFLLDEYFAEYRELKITGRVTLNFCEKARRLEPPSSVQSRDAMVQQYASDEKCALLVVDAMGAEWLPMLVALSRERNLGMEFLAVGKAHLPTTTQFNSIHWPCSKRRLPAIKRFDNIAHNGAETHEIRRAEENLAAALDVISSEVLPRVAEGLMRFERVLVTADHGSSRLAVLARHTEPMLMRILTCETGAEVADWRYRERAVRGGCPPELEETLDGRHWVVRGYNRLPKKGGGQSFELHGGATLEERLVPVIIFSKKGQFIPKARTDGKRVQIVEKDDFDL